jgi:hypothetical protein
VDRGPIRYARSGNVNIAYQVFELETMAPNASADLVD